LIAQSFLQENNVQVEAWAPLAEGKNNIFKMSCSFKSPRNTRKARPGHLRCLYKSIIALQNQPQRRMLENISAFDFELSEKIWRRLQL